MVDYYCLGVLLYEMLVGLPPFYDSNKCKMYSKIMYDQPKFPSHVSNDARDLINKLLEKNPDKRIGAKYGVQEIIKHAFCRSIDCDKI